MVVSTLQATNQLPEPFDGKSAAYRAWKQRRLQLQDKLHSSLHFTTSQSMSTQPCLISSSAAGSQSQLATLCSNVRDQGYALYQWRDTPEDVTRAVEQLHSQLSLTRHDSGVVRDSGGLSLLQDMSGTDRGRFIPYTARAMGWHTDGYYNDLSHTLRSFTLHCINQAASGGALSLLDYELILIALYDEDPHLVSLLCDKQSMTLPANKSTLGHDRPDRHAPVLFNHSDGELGVRFTTRTQNISWRTADTQAAAERMAELIEANSQWHQTVLLQSGQGIITRNILHKRQAFVDQQPQPRRQVLRGRYTQVPELDRAI